MAQGRPLMYDRTETDEIILHSAGVQIAVMLRSGSPCRIA